METLNEITIVNDFVMPAKVAGSGSGKGSKYYPATLHALLEKLDKAGQGFVLPRLDILDKDGNAIPTDKQVQPIGWRIANAFKGTGRKFVVAMTADGKSVAIKMTVAATKPAEQPEIVTENVTVTEPVQELEPLKEAI